MKPISLLLLLFLSRLAFGQCEIHGTYDLPIPSEQSELCLSSSDLLELIACMSSTGGEGCSAYDFDGNGSVGTTDILIAIPALRDDCQEIYQFPLVFHVIHLGEAVGSGTNISDAQIHSQVDALNAAFNPDAFLNPGLEDDYHPTSADLGIRFVIHDSIAPGQTSPGITRHFGPGIVDGYANSGLCYTGSCNNEQAIKEATTWGYDQAINVWCVNTINNGSSILGYAYFPRTDYRDGIVMLADGVGSILHGFSPDQPTLFFNRDEGDLGIHEFGHYFGLYHVFRFTEDCSEEINCESSGDRVCDTAPTPQSPISCDGGACNNPAVMGNWMHYTSEVCRNRFTPGQRARARAYATNEVNLPKLQIVE